MNSLSSSIRRVSKRVWICRSCQKRSNSTSGETIQSPARTRFAPSPTGYLHLGSLRTALFNYLFAKSTGGQFILRIEDTDQSRTIADSEARLTKDLKWAGLEWDEGPDVGGPYGPYRQSERTELYQEHAQKLLQSGHAYRCFCGPERLQTMARHRQLRGLPPDYDRTCFPMSTEESEERASKGEAHVIRLKVPDMYPDMKDLVHKTIRFKAPTEKEKLYPGFEDPVLLKSDGFPTYHLANVVDDYHMKITHVIRGEEWINSTPKHLVMYNAFGWKPPIFAHVGLLTNIHGSKLSKRSKVDGIDMNVESLRDEQGVLPEALTNFVALLGWSHRSRSDIMNLQELVQNFTPKFTKGNAIVSFEKLWYLQRSHAEKLVQSDAPAVDTMIQFIRKELEANDEEGLYPDLETILNGREKNEFIREILKADSRNYTTAKAFLERNKFFFTHPTEEWLAYKFPDLKAVFEKVDVNMGISILDMIRLVEPIIKTVTTPTTQTEPVEPTEPTEPEAADDTTPSIIRKVNTAANSHSQPWYISPEFNVTDLNTWINRAKTGGIRRALMQNGTTEKKSLEMGVVKAFHAYLRWAVMGGMPGPGSAQTMVLVGEEETKRRLVRAGRLARELLSE